MLPLRQNQGGKPKPRVQVCFPENPLEFKWVTAIEHPEQPGATLWVEEELESYNTDIEPVGRAAELKKSADAYFASYGTKTDSWTCMICGQWDDHWPPMCPNKHLCPELELQPIMVPSCGNYTPAAAGDSLVDVDHWQCRLCGEMDNHWPAMCPYRYLHPIFDVYRGNRAGTSTYVRPGPGPAKGDDVFCRICGGLDHVNAICKHKYLVKEFKGTPPPIVTISKVDTPEPSSPIPSWSSDYLVLPDIFDDVGREREAVVGGQQVEFFNSLGDMIHYIRQANKKSQQTGKNTAERPVVIGGAFNRRFHRLEYCMVCCTDTDHPGFLCPYKEFVPTGAKVGPGCVLVCCLCGTEDCRMHPQRRAAPIVCFVCGAMFDHQPRDCPDRAGGSGKTMYVPPQL